MGGFQVCFFDPYKGSCSAIDLDIFLRAGSTTRKKQPLIAGLERCPDCGRRKVLPHHLPNQHVTGLFCFFFKEQTYAGNGDDGYFLSKPRVSTEVITAAGDTRMMCWSHEAISMMAVQTNDDDQQSIAFGKLRYWYYISLYMYLYIYIYLALAHRCFTQQRPSNSEFLCQHCIYIYIYYLFICLFFLILFFEI